MKTKEGVFKILEKNQGDFCSGQDLANCLNVSRTAVWKAVKGLKEDGLDIESVTKKGYRLNLPSDLLNEMEIREHLNKELKSISLHIYDKIDSTNNEAARMDEFESQNNFSTFFAEEQTQGKGRSGKSFDSPKNTGIYMSVIIKPELLATSPSPSSDLITIKAAVALLLAIEKTTNIRPDIKWVNDLYLNGKKIAGILTEGKFSDLKLERLIIGIGLNVNTEKKSFSKEIQKKADSLFPEKVSRSKLAAEILNQLHSILFQSSNSHVLEIYKKKNIVLGKRVSFSVHDIQYCGLAQDINEKGHLIVNMDGEDIELTGGEISIQHGW